MDIQAAEISAILKQQIKDFGAEAQVSEIGQVLSVGDGIARVYGLDNVEAGEMVEFPGGIRGMALNLEDDNVGVVIFGSDRNIKEGDTVRWRANEYYNNSGTGEAHDVTANDSTWGSGGTMNLGSTYTKTFSTAGTYDYYCSVHPWMYGSVIVTTGSSGGFSSVGVNVVGTNDDITLDGTSVSGFSTAVEQFGGSMTLTGDALLSGGDYGAYAEDTDVVVDGAHLISGANGSAMYVTGTSTLDATDMDTSGKYGLNSDGVDFRWNGGESDADTALIVDGGAEGSVENVTWDDVTTQIDAKYCRY